MFTLSKERTSNQVHKLDADIEVEQLAERFEERRRVYEEVCRQREDKLGRPGDKIGTAPFFYPPANFTLCPVPKIGITFWKRIFTFLSKSESGKAVGSAMDLDRIYVHTHSVGSSPLAVQYGNLSLIRVMFSRNPWKRLWSGYVDKFVFPDSWMDYGRTIVKMRKGLLAQEAMSLRNQSKIERQLAESEKSPRAFHTEDKMVCADDITFAEFLRFVVEDSNPHWSPVHKICNPCVFRPQYLGKMETFGPDSSYVLKVAGLSDTLKLELSHSSHVLDELKQLTSYHFSSFKRHVLSPCVDSLGVARRLWRGFQLNGYIPVDHVFPEAALYPLLSNATWKQAEAVVFQHVWDAHSASPLEPQEWSALKSRHLVAAYRSVPRDVLMRVQQRFLLDFELFQYDKQPAEFFG